MFVSDGISIDQIIDSALEYSHRLPPECLPYMQQIRELKNRLAQGKLHLAVLGQFNRGKSTFINALLGIDLLPISVLPLTSVPTIISLGKNNSCTIEFFKQSKNITEESLEKIRALLTQYVTEENNPENQFGVSKALVECNSPILQNGTVLVDTPGFGSTFVHNTKTTVEYITECDAALFLLSADLPITQVEIEFLKHLHRYVPRMFFIYNKIDLLTKEELEKSSDFITKALQKGLPFLHESALYPVCAKKARENQIIGHPEEPQTGMELVRTEIINFLMREKFFALSHALNKKFDDALNAIILLLEKRFQKLQHSESFLSEKVQELRETLQTINDLVEKEITYFTSEEKALINHVKSLLPAKKTEMVHLVKNALVEQAKSTVKNPSPEKILKSVFPRIIEEMFNRVLRELLETINKPLRKAAIIRERECRKIYSMASQKIPAVQPLPEADDHLYESVELAISGVWNIVDPAPMLAELKTSFLSRFAASQKRIELIENEFFPVLEKNIDENISALFDYLISLMKGSVENLNTVIKKNYLQLISELKKHLAEAEQELRNEQTHYAKPKQQTAEVLQNLHEIKLSITA